MVLHQADIQQSASGYIQLLQQREEENRIEVERLTAEIRALKLKLLQLTGMLNKNPTVFYNKQLKNINLIDFRN